jgi:exosortase
MVAQWWDDPNYSHGFLVPFFSAYLIWMQRRRLKGMTTTGSTIGFLVMFLGVVMLLLGDIGAELFLSRSSLIVIVAGLILFHLGSSVLRQLAFPLAFLLFMVPLPAILFYAITFPLQRLAAENAAWMLELVGIPVLLDGNVLQLSHVTLGVTEACSGVRSLISLLALGVAWGYLTLDKSWAMAALTASAVPITILANAGRIVSTGLIGQWFGMTYAQGFYHTVSGWLIFVIAFVAMLGVHGLIKMFGMIQRGRTA